MGIKDTLLHVFKNKTFTLKEAYDVNSNVNQSSVRARIYENIGDCFERIGKGLYYAKDKNCILIHGDGRDLSMLEDSSIDCIITDHPWLDDDSNKGGNRNFTPYECFQYTLEDFYEKARVLKDGSFLCEILPHENENNYEYLYSIKDMAKKAGLFYYAKIPWRKVGFVANTGRCSKNTDDIMIFSKGLARDLRVNIKTNNQKKMSGTSKMLPTEFAVPPVQNNNKICKSEKPVELFKQLLEYVTLEGETVLDQFAGSGAVGIACLLKNRKSILIEKLDKQLQKMSQRINLCCVN